MLLPAGKYLFKVKSLSAAMLMHTYTHILNPQSVSGKKLSALHTDRLACKPPLLQACMLP